MIIKNSKLYDALKFIALILLPALGSAYFGLAGLWNFPNPDSVVGSIVIIDTLLGTTLGLSTAQYNNSDAKYDGSLEIQLDAQGLARGAVQTFDIDPDDLAGKTELIFKVNPVTMDFSDPSE